MAGGVRLWLLGFLARLLGLLLAEQLVGGDPKGPGQGHQLVQLRRGVPQLPFAHRLPGHSYQGGQLLLGQLCLLSVVVDFLV